MANMSYCRFRNTRADLSDCLASMNEGETMSEAEATAGKAMFNEFLEFCYDYGIIDERIDRGAVDEIFDTLTEG